jgi:hypothetical protein
MDETPHPMPNTASGRPHGTPGTHLRLPDLPDFKLGVEGDLNGFDATDSEFLQFVQSLVPLTGENLEHWTWEERRDFLNWCLDEQVLTIKNGRLVSIEETIPTVPLHIDTEGDAPGSVEAVDVVHDGEDDVDHIIADPSSNTNELAEAPGLLSDEVSSQEVHDVMHAQQSTKEGPGDALTT